MNAFVKKYMNDISIRHKVFYAYIVMLLMAFIILIIANTLLMTNDVEDQTLYSADRALTQTKSFIEYKVASTKNVLNILAINDTLQEILERELDAYETDIGRWTVDSNELQKILFYAKDLPGTSAVKIYFTKSLGSLYENSQYLNLNKYTDKGWYKLLSAGTNKIHWFTNNDYDEANEDSIIAMKKIPSRTDLNEIIGIIRVDYASYEFDSLLEQANVTENTSAMIFNPHQVISTSSDFSNHLEMQSQFLNYASNFEELSWSEYAYEGDTYHIGIVPIEGSDWKLLLSIPAKDITQDIYRSQYGIFFILLAIIPITMFLAYFVASTITKRIAALITRIQEIEYSNFDQTISTSGKDEVGILANNFNYMLVKISMLLDEKFKLGQELTQTELKALQAQINPHFLYNTLDQIYWLGVQSETPMISDLVLQLSKFYKLSLSKGKSLVSLENELAHIEAYVKIQNHRFDDAITLSINIPDAHLDTSIPKITLQPIIENAILHGIMETESESGNIIISSTLTTNDLLIHLKDDGVGINPESLSTLMTNHQSSDLHGYGLQNIDSRLKLTFGQPYGLSFESVEGEGTTVIVRIPFK